MLNKTRKKNTGLIKLRKGEMKKNSSKKKENNVESFTNLYEEYLINRKKYLPMTISKRSIDILSSNNLTIYNEINELNDNNKEESAKIKSIENPKKVELSNNISKKTNNLFVNSTKYKKEKKNKNEELFLNNEIKKENSDSNIEIDNNGDINNKTYSFLKSEKNLYDNINNKKTKDVFNKTIKKKKPKYNHLKEEEDTYDEQNQENQDLNINIFYEGKGISLKMSKDEILSNCLSSIQKILFPFYRLSDYDILYKLKILDIKSLSNEKLINIIENSGNSATFYLRKKIIKNLNNNKDTTVLIENFPSFTDLATELNKFFEKEKRESNFTVDYKGNICKVKFSDSEKAFSLIIYMTQLKKRNPIFRRLKIRMDYKLNVVLDTKKLKQKSIKLFLPLIDKNSLKTINVNKSNNNDFNKKLQKIFTEKNINNYKSRNERINCNSMNNKSKNIKYNSCITLNENRMINDESKYSKNRIKSNDSPINLKIHSNKNAKNKNNDNYSYDSHINNRNIINIESKINNNINKKVNDSEEMFNKLTKIKSTNFIIDLNKSKTKNWSKNFTFKDDNENSFSPKIRPIRKSNYYNLIIQNLSKKYKSNLMKENNNEGFSFDE